MDLLLLREQGGYSRHRERVPWLWSKGVEMIYEFPVDAGEELDVELLEETPPSSWEEVTAALVQFLDDINGEGNDN